MNIKQPEDRAFTLYKISNLVNDKLYIGITSRCHKKRLKEHKKQKTTLISKAIKKYGADLFKVEALAIGSFEYILDLEIRAIERYRCHVTNGGYNLTKGGQGHYGYRHTKEAREKIGQAAKRPMTEKAREMLIKRQTGRVVTEETREKIRKSLTGRKANPAAIEKMKQTVAAYSEEEKRQIFINRSKAQKGIKKPNRKSRVVTDETKEKIRRSLIGHSVSEETRRKISETKRRKRHEQS